ncbi:NAD(P)-dependent dehydrogenase (short-subunit alcohol dehydrogenase family) [Melghirimyces profundicolus]|uniref:NAD(P)-dependent dehydrogenase (Short-subunit alcohol dehydrogenase family) n=1 Tax=Melghirimyces profundicolus TaxID=1242148 RepID=A0A2T6C0C1_9BACL|nr:SDR family oxidoreductase [Melghirimyces profundicolus]PTX61774.1 NAD(P)-dependent dehydrogenase (short-subunit alcohol dehydrogenase family) [Melghirimyces profundicolus]
MNSDYYPVYPYYGRKTECMERPVAFPPQSQDRQPGLEYLMHPRPISENPSYRGSGKLHDRTAVITGGDSGIGRAVAYAFAKEGADLVLSYLDEHRDAKETQERILQLGRRCLLIPGDLKQESHSAKIVQQALDTFGKIDILVNNHAVQIAQKSILDITADQLDLTFRTNLYSFVYLTKAALPHLKPGSTIINTTSVTAYEGSRVLIDYSSTKGAIVTLTRSLALSLVEKGIRVNAVAPGPIWTPLTVSTFRPEEVSVFGTNVPMKRAGQPFEIAPSYVYLASDDSCYMTGQVLHPNGGIITGS